MIQAFCTKNGISQMVNRLTIKVKTVLDSTTALKVKNTTSFETKSTLDVFKNYSSTLADNILKKLPISPNRCTFNSIMQCYRHFIQTDAFYLTYTTEIDVEKILKTQTFVMLQV